MTAAEKGSSNDEIENFHEWRSMTGRILSKKITTETIEGSIQIVRRACLSMFQASVAPQVIEFDEEELDSIIQKAIELSVALAKQRADFHFTAFREKVFVKVKFNPETMTCPFEFGPLDEESEIRCREMTLAPGLIKYGSSEGKNFDTSIVIMKAQVETRICNLKH